MTATTTIDDRREGTRWIPAVATLERILPLLPREHLAGIRSIILLDDDYRAEWKGKSVGRYVPISGTNRGDIELYFALLTDVPEEAAASSRYWFFTLTNVLAHELYHHHVRRPGKRLPTWKVQQAEKDRWGTDLANQVYHGQPDCEQHWEEWDRIKQAFERKRRRAGPGSG